MGRLVDLNDAKALIEDIYKRDKDTIKMSYKKDNIITGLDELDTAYDVDAVVEQLEKKIQTHERCIEYEKKNGTITEEFQQRKAVKEFRIWCQCNNPYGVACTSVRNIKCNRPIHHDYGVISLPNGQCV